MVGVDAIDDSSQAKFGFASSRTRKSGNVVFGGWGRVVDRDPTQVNILFDLFEYKPSRPCATVTFSSGNTKSGSNAEAAPAIHVRTESILFGIWLARVCFVRFVGWCFFFRCRIFNVDVGYMKNIVQKRTFNIWRYFSSSLFLLATIIQHTQYTLTYTLHSKHYNLHVAIN